MRIFSRHQKKLDPKRRFGSKVFQSKVEARANYQRVFKGPKSNWNFWRWFVYGGLALFVYFFILSSQLVIGDISVSGNKEVSVQAIQDVFNEYANSRWFMIKRGNFFFLRQGKVERVLKRKIPAIKNVARFNRIWPNKAEISIMERNPGFAIKSNNNYFLVDDEGIVVSPIRTPEKLLVAEDSLIEDFASGEPMPNPKMAPFIISVIRLWSQKLPGELSLIKFPGKAANDVQFISSEGWSVFFDIAKSSASQIASLSVILNKQVGSNRNRLAYVDLRLAKSAYYCFLNTPCSQISTSQIDEKK